MQKHLLIPSRLRQIPRQFSWIDQRLVRDHYIERCDPQALALYLFLVTVADAQGLSYYANHSIERLLSFTPQRLAMARETLIRAELIACDAPLVQVLALDTAQHPQPAHCDPTTPDPDHGGARLRSLRALLGCAVEEIS